MQNLPQTTEPKRLPELFAPLKPHMGALDRFLLEQIEAFEPEIRDRARYCLDNEGKRIRPSLIFFSGCEARVPVDPDLVKLAAIIEIVHLATLVHDDIMDGAELRRGRATVARAYGNETAVLLGDALFSHAVLLATEFPSAAICRRVALAMRRVCSGEILQTMQRRDSQVDLPTYRRIVDLKTAELFRVACQLGAELADRSPAFVEAVATFGRRLGVAYQIYDDLADLFGSQAKLGKTLGTDIETGKATLPLILLRESLPAGEAAQLDRALAGEGRADNARWIAQIRERGIFEQARQTVREEIEAAREAIAPFQSGFEGDAAAQLDALAALLRKQAEAL